MSSSNEINNDLIVSRNLDIGGKLDVKGNATMRHNLKVDGWLDAKNVKGPNKGLFLSLTALQTAYPAPNVRDGWFAGVAEEETTDGVTDVKYRIYLVNEQGQWVVSNPAAYMTFDTSLDTAGLQSQIDENADAIEALEQELESQKNPNYNNSLAHNISTNAGKIRDNEDAIEELKQELDGNTNGTLRHDINENASDIDTLRGQLAAIILGAQLTLKAYPAVVQGLVPTAVRLVATMSGVTPETIEIKDSSTLITVSNARTAETTVQNLNVPAGDSTSFYADAVYRGAVFTASVNVVGRNLIRYGFAADIEELLDPSIGQTLSARTTAAAKYSSTNSHGDGISFFILVPTDVGTLSTFTMGDAPYVMHEKDDMTMSDGIMYHVYKSGASYDIGAEVNVQAS